MRKRIGIALPALLGWAMAAAPAGGPAAAQTRNTASYETAAFFLAMFLSPAAFNEATERREILSIYGQTLQSLEAGNAPFYRINRNQLLDKAGRAGFPDNAKLAQQLLRSLPKRYLDNVAFVNRDGTVAADPDASIRASLRRARDLGAAGDGTEAE